MALAGQVQAATIITQWTFEGETLTPSTGTGTATLGTGSSESFPAGWGSTDAWSSAGWAVNEYFQFQISTTGYEDITVGWQQTGSDSGPANFALQYSTNGSSWTQFGAYNVTNDGWNGTLTPAASVKSFDLSGVSTIEDAATVYFRLVNLSTDSIGGGTVVGAGNSRIDNFTISGTEIAAIPEPSLFALVGLGMTGVLLRRRRPAAV